MPIVDADLDEYRDLSIVDLMASRHSLAVVSEAVDQYYENVPGGFQDEDDNARFGVKVIDVVMEEKGAPPGSLAYQLASDHGTCAFLEQFWRCFSPSQKAYLKKRFHKDKRKFAEPGTAFLKAVGEMVVTHYHELMDTHNNRRTPIDNGTEYAQRSLARYKKQRVM